MVKCLIVPYSVLCMLFLAGCSAEEQKRSVAPDASLSDIMSDTASHTVHGATHIIEEPFEDVGLKRDAVPQVLTGLTKNPYIMPGAPLCENLNYEIIALNEVLGTDMGSKGRDGKPSYTEEGLEAAQGKVSDMLRDEMKAIPFRGVVRRISGADAHARKVAAAYDAGRLRRAYLKGLSQSYRCSDEKKP